MSLVLESVGKLEGGEAHLSDIDLRLEPGGFNVLLGRTLAGKTSLMRVMAGLDRPTQGRVMMNGKDVTGVPVRKRNLSMVYQQFINYPGMTVYDNIGSPLRQARMPRAEIDRRVRETAALLRIDNLLQRYPLELSGGQQQRTAMARALVKDAELILFDEPLVNLDYKLREEFRSELRTLFRTRDCIAVYATTEPTEALALGGHVAVLHEGRLVQFGPTPDVYRRPRNALAARMFSEPPMNIIPGTIADGEIGLDRLARFPSTGRLAALDSGAYQFGVRASHLRLDRRAADDVALDVPVVLSEISGSETFLHVGGQQSPELGLHLPGVHDFEVGESITVYLPVDRLYVFDQAGEALMAIDDGEGLRHG